MRHLQTKVGHLHTKGHGERYVGSLFRVDVPVPMTLVSRGGDGHIGMLLPQFVKQMCPSAYDANAVAIGCKFLEKDFSYAGGGSNDNDVLFVHLTMIFVIPSHKVTESPTKKPPT